MLFSLMTLNKKLYDFENYVKVRGKLCSLKGTTLSLNLKLFYLQHWQF